MGRPRRVYPQSLHKYDKLHTKKQKMYSGVQITGLHLVKETNQFFLGLESWSSCCGTFKKLKFGTELEFNIPVAKQERTVEFLEKRGKKDWVEKRISEGSTDMKETVDFLDKVFPGKDKKYFFELSSLIDAFCSGNFISYDKDGNVETLDSHSIEQIKYYNYKYQGIKYMGNSEDVPDSISNLFKNYLSIKGDNNEKQKAFDAHYDAVNNYLYEHKNMNDIFIHVGENAIVCPFAYTNGTAQWSIEKYGEEIAYAKAGEIYMVVTENCVYFDIQRHF